MGQGQLVLRLSPEDWGERHRQLAALDGPAESAPAGAAGDRAFEDARARDAEEVGDAFAARWHLDRLIAAGEDGKAGAPGGEAGPAPAGRWSAYARRARLETTAGRFDRADADYARARALGSREELLGWYRYRIADCVAGKHWHAVLWYAERVLAASEGDWHLDADRALAHEKLGQAREADADLDRAVERGADSGFLLRLADDYAGKGRWDRAAAALRTAGERGPLPLVAWQCQALACLKTGDAAGYRRVCAGLMAKAGPAPPAELANDLAWVCALGPEALPDYTRPLALAGLAESKAPPEGKHNVLDTLGAVLYRAGRFREAIARLEEGVRADKDQGGPADWAFLAMAHQCLGEATEARTFLEKALQAGLPENGSPWARLEIEVLRREAEAVVKGSAADPRK
jgi:tetratricopeptide (TPR) repeat protein